MREKVFFSLRLFWFFTLKHRDTTNICYRDSTYAAGSLAAGLAGIAAVEVARAVGCNQLHPVAEGQVQALRVGLLREGVRAGLILEAQLGRARLAAVAAASDRAGRAVEHGLGAES